MTHWVLVDVTSSAVRSAVHAACNHIVDANTTISRVALLPFVRQAGAPESISQYAFAATASLAQVAFEQGPATLCKLAADAEQWEHSLAMLDNRVADEQRSALAARLQHTSALAAEARCEDAAIAVITNGRVVALTEGAQLMSGDLQVMEHVAMRLQPGEQVHAIMTAAQDAARNGTASGTGVNSTAEKSGRQLSDLALVAACAATAPPEPSGWGGAGAEQALFRSGNLQHSARLQAVFARLRSSELFIESKPEQPCSQARLVVQVLTEFDHRSLSMMGRTVQCSSHVLALFV